MAAKYDEKIADMTAAAASKHSEQDEMIETLSRALERAGVDVVTLKPFDRGGDYIDEVRPEPDTAPCPTKPHHLRHSNYD